MTGNEYQKAALITASKLCEKDLVLNGVMGLNGESGECIDAVKKQMFQGHSLDKQHLAEELGDVLWYIAITAKGIGYNLDDIMQGNVNKLKKRYPDGFSAERSVNRPEKRETTAHVKEIETACIWKTKNFKPKEWPCGSDGEKACPKLCEQCWKEWKNQAVHNNEKPLRKDGK